MFNLAYEFLLKENSAGFHKKAELFSLEGGRALFYLFDKHSRLISVAGMLFVNLINYGYNITYEKAAALSGNCYSDLFGSFS